jgi:hypothetical protein
MHKYKYNPEHFHATEGVLFTVRNAYDETLWETLTDETTDINNVMVRLPALGGGIECYVDLVEFFTAWFEEGYFSSTIIPVIDDIYAAYVEFCKRTNTEIPAKWKM